MAGTVTRMLLGLSLTLLVAFAVIRPAKGIRTMVGERTEVPDVGTNQEVQDLGRYCVEEFNMKAQEAHGQIRNGSDQMFSPLMFSRVVKAQEQIVSGKKYFLRIEVTSPDGTTRMFDSVVVVKPWLQSRELLQFSPVVDSVF